MFNLTKYNPRVVDVLDVGELPKDIFEHIHDIAADDELNMVDYSDGDFYWLVDLKHDASNNSNAWWLEHIKLGLPAEVIKRNLFAIYFSQ